MRKIVKKYNNLIMAKNSWSELEGKLFATLLTQLNPKSEDDFREMILHIDDIEALWGVKLNTSQVKLVCNELNGKSYEIPEYKEDGSFYSYLFVSLFDFIRYVPEEKHITFNFHRFMKPYILNFTSRFVQYNIDNILQFKNKYSLSFYEKFKYIREERRKIRKETISTEMMSIEEIHEWLQTPKSYNKLYSDFKRKLQY